MRELIFSMNGKTLAIFFRKYNEPREFRILEIFRNLLLWTIFSSLYGSILCYSLSYALLEPIIFCIKG